MITTRKPVQEYKKRKINQSAQPEHKHRNIFKYYDKLICLFAYLRICVLSINNMMINKKSE